MLFNRELIGQKVAKLAQQGVFIGTSSWKYEGWRGILYDEARYIYRGKFAETRFERLCLKEYAEVFKTVSLDASYYKFPDQAQLEKLTAQVTDDFQFGFKVTDEITLKRFTNLPRHGVRAGKPNDNFLNAELFANAFLKPCEDFRQHVGVIMFEFSRFYPTDYEHGRDFVADLDRFLDAIPKGWPYAVELRNKHWLQPEYLNCLTKHGVAHVFNNWEAMPPVIEQLDIPGTRTAETLTAARFLLKPGRKYEHAVKTFSPYSVAKEPNPEARTAGKKLIAEGKAGAGKKKTFIYVNNRLEGNALETIAGMLE